MSKPVTILTHGVAILVVAPMIGLACGGTLGMAVYAVIQTFRDLN